MIRWMSRERRLRMVWRVVSQEGSSYLVGTAHFFPFSFKRSLADLIGKTGRVLFEGPLDEADMASVRRHGIRTVDGPSLNEALDRATIAKIEKEFAQTVTGDSRAAFTSYLGLFDPSSGNSPLAEIEHLKPWMAFFTIWAQFLRRRGWQYSVDLQAFEAAQKLGKEIHFLETIEEQVRAMDGIPFEDLVSFVKDIGNWEKYSKDHARRYRKGDIQGLMTATTRFPTRCPSIVESRDPVLFARMIPYIEQGDTIAFVGTTHIRGITRMLEQAGYRVEGPLDEG
jgi:uncharacterized protein YbaP (TraB family)